MNDRRDFLRLVGSVTAGAAFAPWQELLAAAPPGVLVNDIHSKLNATRVRDVFRPGSAEALRDYVLAAGRNAPISIAGGRHSMGGQQFGADGHLVDMTGMARVLALDAKTGIVEVEAGIEWPELVAWLVEEQRARDVQWGIRQKQTGADRLSIGGALASNVHGRGLTMAPFVGDVESFTLVDAAGKFRTCSRRENAELFRLAIGGYGLFGVIATVRLRLMRRTKIERVVRTSTIAELAKAMDARVADGFLFGDGQFAIDPASDEFLDACVFSCYRPLPDEADLPTSVRELADDDWRELLALAHTAPSSAFEKYRRYYLTTDGQRYWSDTHQLATYLDDYHSAIDRAGGATHAGSEMISEVYVPRAELPNLMAKLRLDFRKHGVRPIYGTVRAIERDDESFLPWAKERWLCTVMNFHVDHSPAGLAKAQADFRRLFDAALAFGGSFFLTYHRWAERRQIEAAYPMFKEFLRQKRKFDPAERFRSTWYDHYRQMFG